MWTYSEEQQTKKKEQAEKKIARGTFRIRNDYCDSFSLCFERISPLQIRAKENKIGRGEIPTESTSSITANYPYTNVLEDNHRC